MNKAIKVPGQNGKTVNRESPSRAGAGSKSGLGGFCASTDKKGGLTEVRNREQIDSAVKAFTTTDLHGAILPEKQGVFQAFDSSALAQFKKRVGLMESKSANQNRKENVLWHSKFKKLTPGPRR